MSARSTTRRMTVARDLELAYEESGDAHGEPLILVAGPSAVSLRRRPRTPARGHAQ